MRIWRLFPDTNSRYAGVIPTDEFFTDRRLKRYWYFEIGNKPEGTQYTPVEVHKRYKSKKLWNIPYFFDRLVIIDEKAKASLEPLLKNCNVEILPLICKDAPLYIINYLDRFKAEDVLDMERSVVKRYECTGDIMYVSRHYFKKALIADKHIFSVHSLTVCDDEFKNAVVDSGLTGLCFQLLWQCDDKDVSLV
ncbi:MAG: hypothetical protein IJR59_05470 [Firmicutes bacterium]|nr:hypothetical protein [Bacillota bacterium]